jgi:hypothetical protein
MSVLKASRSCIHCVWCEAGTHLEADPTTSSCQIPPSNHHLRRSWASTGAPTSFAPCKHVLGSVLGHQCRSVRATWSLTFRDLDQPGLTTTTISSSENVVMGSKEDRILITGLHTVADVTCLACSAQIGWKYLHAMEPSQKYKEGAYIIERGML